MMNDDDADSFGPFGEDSPEEYGFVIIVGRVHSSSSLLIPHNLQTTFNNNRNLWILCQLLWGSAWLRAAQAAQLSPGGAPGTPAQSGLRLH